MDPSYIRSAWTVLTSVAQRRDKITYGDLVTQSGWTGVPQAVGMLLNPVYYDVCKPRGWPDLSAVAVSTATGKPSPGWWKDHGRDGNLVVWREELERCYKFNWPAQPPGF